MVAFSPFISLETWLSIWSTSFRAKSLRAIQWTLLSLGVRGSALAFSWHFIVKTETLGHLLKTRLISLFDMTPAPHPLRDSAQEIKIHLGSIFHSHITSAVMRYESKCCLVQDRISFNLFWCNIIFSSGVTCPMVCWYTSVARSAVFFVSIQELGSH